MGLSLAVYQPWRSEPVDLLDFSEFLPLLHRGSGFWDRLEQLTRYYAGQGRSNVVVYAVIALTYQIGGASAAAWQWSRYCQMFAVVIGVYLILRRLGLTPWSTLAGSLLFVVSGAAAGAWLRQTAEPVGTLFLLGAIGMAIDFRTAVRWKLRVAGIAAAIAGMLLSKETFVACLPFVFALACVWPSLDAPEWRAEGRRFLALAGGMVISTAVVGMAMMAVRLGQKTDAYAALYGTGSMSLGRLVDRAVRVVMPTWANVADTHLLFALPSNFIFSLLLFALTVNVIVRPSTEQRRVARTALLAAGLVLLGVAVYLPWPRFESFYALPFLFGPAMVLAVLLDDVGVSGRWRAVSGTALVMVTTIGSVSTFGEARATAARREVNAGVIRWLQDAPAGHTILVASNGVAEQAWQSRGATLRRFAEAAGRQRLPRIDDVSCAGARESVHAASEGGLIVNYVDLCGVIGVPKMSIQRPFVYFDWQALAFRQGLSRVDIVVVPMHPSAS